MGTRIFSHGNTVARNGLTVVTEGSGIELVAHRYRVNGGKDEIGVVLSEDTARALMSALQGWAKSQETSFGVGDIVYEPNHFKRAGKVIAIMGDRTTYLAPYHVEFIEQVEGQPKADYFAAKDLVLVARKGTLA